MPREGVRARAGRRSAGLEQHRHALAAQRLLDLLDNPDDTGGATLLPTSLVVRDST